MQQHWGTRAGASTQAHINQIILVFMDTCTMTTAHGSGPSTNARSTIGEEHWRWLEGVCACWRPHTLDTEVQYVIWCAIYAVDVRATRFTIAHMHQHGSSWVESMRSLGSSKAESAQDGVVNGFPRDGRRLRCVRGCGCVCVCLCAPAD